MAPIAVISSSWAGRSSLALTALASLVSLTSISPRTRAKTSFSMSVSSSVMVAIMKTALAVWEVSMLRKAARSSMVEALGVATFSRAWGSALRAAGFLKRAI